MAGLNQFPTDDSKDKSSVLVGHENPDSTYTQSELKEFVKGYTWRIMKSPKLDVKTTEDGSTCISSKQGGDYYIKYSKGAKLIEIKNSTGRSILSLNDVGVLIKTFVPRNGDGGFTSNKRCSFNVLDDLLKRTYLEMENPSDSTRKFVEIAFPSDDENPKDDKKEDLELPEQEIGDYAKQQLNTVIQSLLKNGAIQKVANLGKNKEEEYNSVLHKEVRAFSVGIISDKDAAYIVNALHYKIRNSNKGTAEIKESLAFFNSLFEQVLNKKTKSGIITEDKLKARFKKFIDMYYDLYNKGTEDRSRKTFLS